MEFHRLPHALRHHAQQIVVQAAERVGVGVVTDGGVFDSHIERVAPALAHIVGTRLQRNLAAPAVAQQRHHHQCTHQQSHIKPQPSTLHFFILPHHTCKFTNFLVINKSIFLGG